MKRLLLTLAFLPMMAVAGGDYTWKTQSNGSGTVSLVGIIGWPTGVVQIPASVNGKAVTALGDGLFDDYDDITEIVVPDTVTVISGHAFSGCHVQKVTLPRTLEDFACGDEDMYLLQTPDGCKYVPGDWRTGFGAWKVFNTDHLKSVTFSGGQTSNNAGTYYILNGMLFHRLTFDASVNVPYTYRTVVNLIGFAGYGKSGRLIVPDGVNGIVAQTFEDLDDVTELSMPSSLIALGGGHGGGVAGWMGSLSKVEVRGSGSPYRVMGNSLVDTRTKTLVAATKNTVIPSDGSVTKISRWAFSAAPEKVVIPDCVTDIAPSAFCTANLIRRIEVGAGAVNIMGGAFASVGLLAEFVISERNPKYEVVNDCVVEKTGLRSMITPTAHPKHYRCQYETWTYYEYDCHVPYFCRGIVDSAFKDENFVRTVILPKDMQYVPMDDYYNEGVASWCDIERVKIADCSSWSEMESSQTYQELADQFWDHMDEFQGFYWTKDPQVALRTIGRVAADGFGRYAPGSTVTLTANAIDAGRSVRWRDANGRCVGTGPTFSFTMPSEDVLYSVESVSAAEGAYNWDVSENGDGTVTIRGVIGAKPTGVLTIPSTYDGKTVTKVGVEGWDHEQGSFANLDITGLVIPEGVTELSCGAFHGCKKLTSVTLPSTLKVIRDNCFEDCTALKSIVLPEGLERVEHDFLNRTAVSTLNLPSTLVDIEEGALAIPSGRKFTVAAGNPRYRVENGYVYDYVNKVVFMRADYYQKTFVIPDGAVRIAECCFGDCDGGNITIPASVWRIDYGVFCECKGLTVTFLGKEPEVWGGDIFSDSTNVKVYVQPGQGWDDVARQGKWQGVPVAYAPGAVSYWYNFNDDGGITLMRVASGTPSGTWVLPSTYDGYPVTAIGNGFPGSEKDSLATEVIIPASVRVIEDEAFDGMPKLKGVVLNEGLEEIGRDAFLNGGITSVRIPSTVVSMGSAAFGQNPLTKIEVAEGSVNYTVANGLLVDVREKKVVLSVRDQGKLVVPEGIKAIGVNAFEKVKLSSVTFPTTLESLEEQAFGTGGATAGGFSFSELDFSNTGLGTVGAMAFRACSNLKTVRFPAALESVGSWAFLGCTGLSAVYFAGAVPEVTGASQELLEWAADDLPQLLELYPAGDIYVAWSGNPLPRLKSVATYVTPEHGWETICQSGAWQGRPVKMKTMLTVAAGEGGTATGGGAYDSGTKVTLKATPARDYLFHGWRNEYDELLSQSASFMYVTGNENMHLNAEFILATADYANVRCEFEGEVETGAEIEPIPVYLDCGSTPTVKMTGLPSGLKFTDKDVVVKATKTTEEHTVPANTIYGTPTKSGIYDTVISVTTAGKKTATCHVKFIVRNSDEKIVDVRYDAEAGKVMGMGICKIGKALTLKATPNKGYVLNGWYDGELRLSQAASYAHEMKSGDKTLDARFIEIRDDWLTISNDTETLVFVKGVPMSTDLVATLVDSGSAPTVKVSGLPSGLKFDAKTLVISGTAGKSAKAGAGYFTVEAKNAGGYTFTCVLRYAVVDSAGDPIPDDPALKNDAGIDFADLADGFTTGRLYPAGAVEPIGFVVCATDGAAVSAVKVSNLPAGLSAVVTLVGDDAEVEICGTPTKPGRFIFKVEATFSDKRKTKRTSECAVIVADGGSSWLEVESEDEKKGTVTGPGVYAAGQTVKLSAKAAKNHVFSGWYWDKDGRDEFEDCWTAGGDWRQATMSFTMGAATDQTGRLLGTFVSTADDGAVTIVPERQTWTIDPTSNSALRIRVDSVSLPTLKIAGAPKGVVANAKEMLLSYSTADQGKLVPGVYDVTLDASNVSKVKADPTKITVIVPNKTDARIGGLDPDPYAYPLYAGVMLDPETIMPEIDIKDGWTLAVAGLPSGLKLVKPTADDPAYYVTGVATKAGSNTVTFTATKGKGANKETAVATITLSVATLPAWAQGSFDGAYYAPGYAVPTPLGSVNISVTASGKVSGKLLKGGKSYSFSAANLDAYDGGAGEFIANVVIPWSTTDKEPFTVRLAGNDAGIGVARMESAEVAWNKDFAELGQNVWTSRKDLKVMDFATGAKKPKDLQIGDLICKFDSKGVVTLGGKVEGVAASGKSQIVVETVDKRSMSGWMVVYVASKSLENGSSCEVFDLLMSDDDGDGKIDRVTLNEER